MIRRQFIKLATLTGAIGLPSFGALEALRETPKPIDAKPVRTIIWHVRGFTCITCAVGLETLLHREKGVVAANATYPEGMVTIEYDPDLVTENALRATIAELGFTAEEPKG